MAISALIIHSHDLIFPDNIYYNNISKISDIVKNNNLLIVPDSTTIQSLIGSLNHKILK